MQTGRDTPLTRIAFTEHQLRILMDTYFQGVDTSLPENHLEKIIGDKLNRAYLKLYRARIK